MSRAGTKQRTIAPSDLEFVGYLRAPDEAKPTALGLWLHTDLEGRRELVPELIAAAIYPGRAATDLVIEHVLLLEECGFLQTYDVGGREYLELRHRLRADTRGAPPSECPPAPDRGIPRDPVAVGGASARERAEARVRAEQAERASEWAAWEQAQERPRTPRRPLLLDAPNIGCPDHPGGQFADCGPCGTARRRHDRWIAQERYTQQVATDEEPF
ncbi:hypothetical protein BKA24_001665 [Microbacterium marinum]|uniref:Uncharacterized protein n=1 Tax=Microbacterium marinum TaxID=421115 RepID=A0A7W7BQG7_9MICO|nr:hypothetical protein [Microbacterium marinum]MBB4666956.1 hypothetical protein [Microbacterium marinum]